MTVKENIIQKLTSAFSPILLEVEDESHQHQGHAGIAPGSHETHFHVVIVSEAFEKKNRLQRQRAVYDALKKEMAESIHALRMHTLTPQEHNARSAL